MTHLVARRMRVRSIQRVASKSSSVSILKVVSRVIATAAASWSKPLISVCVSSPVVHLHEARRVSPYCLAPEWDWGSSTNASLSSTAYCAAMQHHAEVKRHSLNRFPQGYT